MADLNKIIDELSKLTVVEAAELSKQLEEKWGVSAAVPVAANAAPAAGGEAAAEEKSEFDIVLAETGSNKITPKKEKKVKKSKSDKPQLSKRAKIIWLNITCVLILTSL